MEESRYQVPKNFSNVAEERTFWAKIIADQLASGMGSEKFCKQQQVNFSKFHYWKYAKVRPDCIGAATNKTTKLVKQCQDKKINKFVSLQISPKQAVVNNQQTQNNTVRSSETIEVIFKNGHKIIVPEAITSDNLSLLIKAVGELQC